MKSFLFAFFVSNCLLAVAQVPQSFNYQAVARNVNGNIIPNQAISVQISIIDSSTSAIVYQEIDTATTNQFGLFTVAIGTGLLPSGNFTTINWATGNKYLQVGFNQNGGLTNFTPMGTKEFLSVPYALYAANSGGGGSGSGWSDYAVYSETQVNNVSSQTGLIDSTWQPRGLNTTESSAGTSISRNGYYITLQPGKYHVSASAQWGLTIVNSASSFYEYAKSVLKLADTSNNLYLLGQMENENILVIDNISYWAGGPNPVESYSIGVEGVITLSSTTTLTLQHYISYPIIDGVNGEYATYTPNAGLPLGLGLPQEVYSRILIQKIN